MAGTCTVGDCERPEEARGMCHSHYTRWHRRARGAGARDFPMDLPIGDSRAREIPSHKRIMIRRLVDRGIRNGARIAREVGVKDETALRHMRRYLMELGGEEDT